MPMVLEASNGNRVELEILGYAYAAPLAEAWEKGDSDANWLRVRIECRDERGIWSCVQTCLRTNEVALLIGRLRVIDARTEPGWNPLEFLEPNLSFEHRRERLGGNLLVVRFDLECRPPWSPVAESTGSLYSISFPLAEISLLDAAAALLEAYRRFPPR
jgi:hypothetical protein